MSSATIPRATAAPVRKRFWRTSTIVYSLAFSVVLALLAQLIIDGGYLRRDIAALREGEAWRTGGWLSQVVLRIVGLIPRTDWQQTALSLIAAVLSGALLGVLYARLRANGWYALGAFGIIAAFAVHAAELHTLTASARAIPLYIAFAALIPAIRSLEDVGDVQSAIGLGLLLPLLLLASPTGTLLILPLALGAALSNADARRDPRAFVAMLLVGILPTIIVAIGIIGFIAQARLDLAEALLPYAFAYSGLHFGDVTGSLITFVVFAPVLIVPVLYCLWPALPERRHTFSALAVIALPLYLAVAREVLTTTMPPIVPPLALITCFVSWLAIVRLPLPLRALSLVMLAFSTVLSWTMTGVWDDPEWKAALLAALPDAR